MVRLLGLAVKLRSAGAWTIEEEDGRRPHRNSPTSFQTPATASRAALAISPLSLAIVVSRKLIRIMRAELDSRRAHRNELRVDPALSVRTLAIPKAVDPGSLTSLRDKLIKIGAKGVSHGRYVAFQMAEVAVLRQIFSDILSLIARLRARRRQR